MITGVLPRPHIKLSLFRWSDMPRQWVCKDSLGITGVGDTAAEAYDDWVYAWRCYTNWQ